MGTQLLPKRGTPQIFGLCLFFSHHCKALNSLICAYVPLRNYSLTTLCLLWPNGWMDQDATWYEGRPRPMPHCVRRGPAPPKKVAQQPPSFRPMSVVATSPISATAELLLVFMKGCYIFSVVNLLSVCIDRK